MRAGLSGYLNSVKKAIGNIGHGQQQATPTLGRIRVGSREIEEIKLISQGGYAYVFKVRDIHTGEIFALKKMICQSPERLNTAKNEIKYLKSLPSHPNLLAVYDTSVENKDGVYYVYVLLEFCADGSIFDLMEKYESTRLSEKQIIFIMREVCEGVKVLHSMKPPIAHRDLKIENVLLSNKKFKLCDFGSCSTSYVDFAKIPQSQYQDYEEEYEKNTTLMYRPPEMCDPYLKQVVCEKVDVWMIGCILFTMCFYKHPFQEMTKLSIVNAAFTFPEDHKYPEKMIDLIRLMLTPNPKTRPSIFEVCDLFENYFNLNSIKLNNDALRVREDQKKKANEMRKFEGSSSRKFQGDIPVDELIKLQQKVAKNGQGFNDDYDGGDYDDDDDYGGGFGDNSKQGKKGNKHGSPGILQAQNQSSRFQDFGTTKNTNTQKQQQEQPQPDLFNSSPGVSQGKDWYNFGTTTSSNQGQTQKKPELQIKTDPQVKEQWDNFSFGNAPQTQKFNSVSGTSTGNNFGFPTQAQTTMNRNVQQTNFFGGNNNNIQNNQGQFNRGFPQQQQQNNGFQQQNNNGFGFPQQNNNFGFQQQQQNNFGFQNNNQAQFKTVQHSNNNGFQQQNNFGFQQQNNQGQFYGGNNNRGFQQQQQQQNNFGNQGFNQGNNTWGNFGGASQQNNNFGGQQNANRATTVSNDLLDLAGSQPVQQDTASMLKALYATSKK